jgi:hypothetical protein
VKEDLIVFQENKVAVRKRLKDGRIDLDLTSWSFQDRLFGFLIEEKFFELCGSSYPTPRQRENIPVWFLLASGIQMKLHRSAAFQRLEYILRSGSILTRVKFNVGLKGGDLTRRTRRAEGVPSIKIQPVSFLRIRRPPGSSIGITPMCRNGSEGIGAIRTRKEFLSWIPP